MNFHPQCTFLESLGCVLVSPHSVLIRQLPALSEVLQQLYNKLDEFSPTTYAEVICYVKLMGELSPTMYAVKVLL